MVVLGCLLLLERLAHFHIPSGMLWPMMWFTIAVTQILERRFGSSMFFLTMTLVFLACGLHWYGMTYEKSWPLLLIAVGIGVVVNTLTRSGRTLGFVIGPCDDSDQKSSGS
jgi:hypothetical protein